MSTMREVILLHGKPGSGKSSAASDLIGVLAAENGRRVHHLSIGDHLRAISNGDYESEYAQQLEAEVSMLRRAEPLSNDLVGAVAEEYIGRTAIDDLLLVDGFPKYKAQLTAFRETIKRTGSQIIGIVGIEVADATALQRMMERGTRQGENPAAREFALQRLEEHATGYAQTMTTLAEEFASYTVDGERPRCEVVQDLAHIVMTTAEVHDKQ